jgi:hypothetical protein
MVELNLTVKITLRNPLDKESKISYTIIPEDNQLARDWLAALKEILTSNLSLEKNFCFMGFPHTRRDTPFLCEQLNRHVKTINLFNQSGKWKNAGLPPYFIEEHFTENSVRFSDEYEIGDPNYEKIGLTTKHGIMNRLHNHFERLQGTVWNLSTYYKTADIETQYAIRQLNNLCHELENVILSQRKWAFDPAWTRPSQITTFMHAPRYHLSDEHRQGFITNRYDRELGGVYMHWAQIGKTLFEVWRDEGEPKLNIGNDPTDISVGSGATCEAITALKYYSGEFDIEWANDVMDKGQHPWHTDHMNQYRKWLFDNGIDWNNPALSLGHLKIGQVDLHGSFGTTDFSEIWKQLGQHLDIYSIEVDGICQVYDYCWSDTDYESNQKTTLKRLENGLD